MELYLHPHVRTYLGGVEANGAIYGVLRSIFPIRKGRYHWGVFLRRSDAFIGLISVTPHYMLDNYELKYQFLPAYWKQGYGRETVGRALAYLLEDVRMREIIAETNVLNTASRDLLDAITVSTKETVERFGVKQMKYIIRAVKKGTYSSSRKANEEERIS